MQTKTFELCRSRSLRLSKPALICILHLHIPVPLCQTNDTARKPRMTVASPSKVYFSDFFTLVQPNSTKILLNLLNSVYSLIPPIIKCKWLSSIIPNQLFLTNRIQTLLASLNTCKYQPNNFQMITSDKNQLILSIFKRIIIILNPETMHSENSRFSGKIHMMFAIFKRILIILHPSGRCNSFSPLPIESN